MHGDNSWFQPVGMGPRSMPPQAAAGTGAYITTGEGMARADSIVPSPGRFVISPLAGTLTGLGQDPNGNGGMVAAGAGISIGFMLAIVAMVGGASYFAGKAMTPSGSKPLTWGLVGVGAGLLGGPIGLGIMGAVALSKD